MAGNAAGNFAAAGVIEFTSVSDSFLVMGCVGVLSSLCFATCVRRRPEPALVPSAAASLDRPLVGARDEADGDEEDSLRRDLSELGMVLRHGATRALLPLLLFIGAENAFWSGDFASIASRLGGDQAASLLIGVLAGSEVLASVAAGCLVDRGRAGAPAHTLDFAWAARRASSDGRRPFGRTRPLPSARMLLRRSRPRAV
jgi:hypothetical protein